MSPAPDQFKFLISCIRWSNSGKVNFAAVAEECEIVSKGAAAKRYERMMKAHGIAPNAASVRNTSYSPNIKHERQTKSSGSPAKKRKLDNFNDDEGPQDDEEENLATNVKPDPEHDLNQQCVKEEMSEETSAHGSSIGGVVDTEQISNEIMSYHIPEYSAEGGYATASSLYEPSTGYTTPSNGYVNPTDNRHTYGLRPHQFMSFSQYQEHSGSEAPDTPASQSSQHEGDHIIISD